MQNLETDQLIIETAVEDENIRIDWKGRSNAREPWALIREFFERVAQEAEEKSSDVEMHFEDIEYFNSSTITAVIRIMQLLQAKKVPLTLFYDPSLRWQKLSFDGLRIFEQSNALLKVSEVKR